MSGKSLQSRGKLADWGLKIKTVNESLVHAIDLTAKGQMFDKAFETAVSWIETVGKGAEYASEVFRPFKLIAKIAEDLTKITDPEKLGYIACTIAFQNALTKTLENAAPHNEQSIAVKEVKEQLREIDFEDLDFSIFDLKFPMAHQFFMLAQANAEISLMLVGYSENQRHRILGKIQDFFSESLKLLFTDGQTADKFKPFKDYLSLGRAEQIARKNLARHVEYQIWQYESAPVLGKEPFALKDVYIETQCGHLTWAQIGDDSAERPERVMRGEPRRPKLDPFKEENGGRHHFLQKALDLIADANTKQPIVVQGVAGAGKTSFTLRLCAELVKNHQMPVRVRLRDINLDQNIDEALPRAIRLSDRRYADKDILLNYEIFKENGVGRFDKVSRYVLILDGWDELSGATSESFKTRVEKVIGKILDKLVRNSSLPFPVKIILTGRPSEQITDGALLMSETPILTIRSLTKEQLAQFVENIQSAVQKNKTDEFRKRSEDFPADYFPAANEIDFEEWKNFQTSKFESVLKNYDHAEKRLEVLGLPLLAHLTAHLIKHWQGRNAADLVENETTLYRNLINLTCEKAGKGQTDKGMSADEAKRLSTFRGADLRKLLWATASAMNVFGDESISYDELERRLAENAELRATVEKVSKENWLSSLLISFYFKGGIRELGCEFSHKSFREYLFAEAIVAELKEYGQNAKPYYEEIENIWEDFPENDARRTLSRNLAKLLSPQWLRNEVIEFLRNLIQWEIGRAKSAENDKDLGFCEPALSLEQWRRVRDGLADVWGWWNYSVHQRPQAEYKKGRYVYEKPAFINELLENALPFSEERQIPPPPANGLDAHLGEAFLYLNVFLHNFLRDKTEENKTPRRHQSIFDDEIRFKPSAKDKKIDELIFSNFYHTAARINSKSGRPRNIFPMGMDLTAVDLSNCFLSGLWFDFANLDSANLDSANLNYANLNYTNLHSAKLYYTNLRSANLNYANLHSAILYYANLDSTNLDSANLWKADLRLVLFLTFKQIKSALINEFTLLPNHLGRFREDLLQKPRQRFEIEDDNKDFTDADEEDESE